MAGGAVAAAVATGSARTGHRRGAAGRRRRRWPRSPGSGPDPSDATEHGVEAGRARTVPGGAVGLEDDGGLTVHQVVDPRAQDRELLDVADAGAGSYEVDDDVDGRGQLAVDGVATEPGRDTERLDARRQIGGGVGVDGAAAALVTGVECGE